MNCDQEDTDDNLFLSPYISVSAVCGNPSFLSQNIRSFSANVEKLKDLLLECPGVMVVGLQEVWQTKHARAVPGFQPLISRVRTGKGGGGVGFLVRNGLKYEMHNTLFLEGQFESMTIKLTFNGKPTAITTVYKPPGVSNSTF